MTKKPKFNNVNRKGRRKKEPFVQLKRYMINHVSWRKLHPGARVIYIELRNRFNGINNGEISLSCREAAGVALCGKDTARRHLNQLIEHGFIKIASKGYFRNRHASTWILTNEDLYDTGPTNEWAKWRPKK